jgi:moderate conductance mechanosensitive channel
MDNLISIDFLNNPLLRQLGLIIIYYFIAWLISMVFRQVLRRIMRLKSLSNGDQEARRERRKTLHGLWRNAITIVLFGMASLASLSLFIDVDTLIWMVGLFSAAFGLGARPLISDFLTGIGFIFEDTYDIGEKVELLETEGVVEKINLRNTWLRSPTGELYVIPNGEIRLIRNFSRGKFSSACVSLKIHSTDIGRALALLEELASEAVVLLPNLLEPWQVISKEGLLGQQAELSLVAKARFGKAAEMLPRLLALVQERCVAANIELAD